MTYTRALVRDPNNKMIAGVCSGIANYFGWDPTVVRVLFAISLLFGGSGFFVYIVLWIVMPEGVAYIPPLPPQGTEYVFEEQVYQSPAAPPYDPNQQYGQGYTQQYGQEYGQPQEGSAWGQPGQPE